MKYSLFIIHRIHLRTDIHFIKHISSKTLLNDLFSPIPFSFLFALFYHIQSVSPWLFFKKDRNHKYQYV